ncbi:unnamed protein product [Mytilus coruscus]|uniref:Integrase catalytic domain-containing protein n=1 Tax=Mytilus coruscus TaxID=42192 RepID=A0A6J8BFL7_MYTCO|nr:unnamed protein product [Mytilus coruscus]
MVTGSRKVFKIKESKADEVTEHLVTLFKNSISNLTEEQRIQMKGVLKRQPEAFANSKNELETKESNAEEEPSCYLRAVKTAEPDSTIREEIEVESTEQGVNWTQSKATEEILAAQQQDDTIAIILKLKSQNQPKPKWEDISLESKQFKTYWAQRDRTTALHPQSDGMIERLNRTIEDILSKFIAKDQRDWDLHLPLAMMAYRSSIHESTGYSPSMLMFGRDIELPVDLLYGQPLKFLTTLLTSTLPN